MATATSVSSLIDDFATVPPGAAAAAPTSAQSAASSAGTARTNQGPATAASGPKNTQQVPAALAAPVEDDETWLARQVASSLNGLGGKPAPAAAGWTDAEWDDDADTASNTPAPSPAVALQAPAAAKASLLDEMDALAQEEIPSSAVGASNAQAPATQPRASGSDSAPVVSASSAAVVAKPAPVESPDDFFAAFGVK